MSIVELPQAEVVSSDTFTAIARIHELDALIRATEGMWGDRGRQVLYDECTRMFTEARNAAGVTQERMNAADGEAQFSFKNAADAERFCRSVVEKFELRNGSVASAEFHIRVKLLIADQGTVTKLLSSSDANGDDLLEALCLPGEVWISDGVYQLLGNEIEADYVSPPPERIPAGFPLSDLRVLKAGLLRLTSSHKCVMIVDMAEFSRIQAHEEATQGVSGVVRLQNQIKEILNDGFRQASSDYERALREFGGDGGIYVFDHPEEAHRVAVGILHAAERESTKGREQEVEEALRCFRIGIAYGECGRDRQGKLTGAILAKARRLESGGPSGEIRVSSEAFQLLPETIKTLYGKEEPIVGKKHDKPIPAHRMPVVPRAPWEKATAPRKRGAVKEVELPKAPLLDCFVISPIDKHDARIAAVFDQLIAPACEKLGFEAKRADHIPGTDRIPLITGRLSSAPLVIAYLGSPDPHWNPDVMLEVGYRVATGLPLVLVSECPPKRGKQSGSFTKILPFHLVNKSVVEVPKDPKKGSAELEAEINAVLTEKKPCDWKTMFPIVECSFTNVQSDITLTEVSPEAAELFGLPTPSGAPATIGQAYRNKFTDRVEPAQYSAYMKERFEIMRRMQARAFGLDSCFDGNGPSEIPPGRIPLIFKDGPVGLSGKPIGYLPLTVRYQVKNGTTHLRILYIKVSDSLRQDPAGHWVCDL